MQGFKFAAKVGVTLAAVLAVYACGGSGGGSASTGSSNLTISGVAATGAAIAQGAVSVKCASGTGTATTNSDGSYTVTVTGGTAPCLLKVTAIDVFGTTSDLYSAVELGQTRANITPLTQMVVASALGANPATVFSAGLNASNTGNLSATSLNTAVTSIQQMGTGLGIDLTGIDPLKTSLVAATDNATGNTQDQKIDGLMLALKNSNVSLATLTSSVVANAGTGAGAASATVTALQAAADVNAPLTISSLASCVIARTGGYLYAGPGDTGLNKVFINFSTTSSFVTSADWGSKTLGTLSGWDYSNNRSFVVTPVNGTNCAFQFLLNGSTSPVNVRVSAGGVGAFSVNGTTGVLPNTTSATFDGGVTSAAGLILPIQKNWTRANLAGTSYGMHFSKIINPGSGFDGIYKTFYSKFIIAPDGLTARAWGCVNPGQCPPETDPPTNTFTLAGPDPVDGTFTMTSNVDTTTTQLAVFVATNGDAVVLGVNTAASTTLTNNFFVSSKRVSSVPKRVVGETWSNINWTINNAAAGAVSQKSSVNSFTATAVNGNSFDRSFSTTSAPANTDTITVDFPITGMISRTNGLTAGTTPGPLSFYGFTGTGWSVYGSSDSGLGTDTVPNLRAKNFLGISIVSP